MPVKPTPVEIRFWRFVVKHAGCWEWTGATNHGYGVINLSRKEGTIAASRLSWQIHNGAIPDGMCVCHTCDNRACANPQHLFLGTRRDNNQDMWRKGRGVFHPSNHPPPVHSGECHPQAKLTSTKVKQIRALVQQGSTGRAVAQRFNVSPTTISNILSRKVWKAV